MSNYRLYLNENGDGFSCTIREHGLPLKGLSPHLLKVVKSFGRITDIITDSVNLIKKDEEFFLEFIIYISSTKMHYSIKPSEVPEFINFEVPESIKMALSCKNRKEVAAYINTYLIGSKVSDEKNCYLVENLNGIQTQVHLFHDDFFERNSNFNGHFCMKGKTVTHEETPQEMLQFVQKRSSFFMKNYKKGQEYHNKSWFNPLWIFTFLNYYFQSLINILAQTFIGDLLGIEETHFCKDFDAGSRFINDLESNEVSMVGFNI